GWAELGHMVIVEDGEPCQGMCTGRGHVESYCSGRAADRLAARVLGAGSTAHELVAARHPALAEIGTHLGTAIGSVINLFNPEDVTLRVLTELREADVVLAEDTRHTRGLLQRHAIEARLLSYHDHNEAARVAEVLPRLRAGERIALVSDAGMPGISDPGERLVRAALEAGVPVTVLPGPSAVETALVASGLAAERYAFVGFLPRRVAELEALWVELAGWRWPIVAFE